MSHAEQITGDIIATGVPGDVVAHTIEPESQKSFAAISEDPEKLHNYTETAVSDDDGRYPPPTEEELGTLRKVAGSLPLISYALCIVEFAERASYYGVQTIFNNFIEFPLPAGGNGAGAPPRGSEETAGALGKGLQFSNAFVLLFTFLAYVIPIFGGWWADTKVGRYKAIVVGVLICGFSHVIMVIGAIPSILQAGRGMAPFMISYFLLAIGAGIFKPNIAPTIIDQYRHQQPYTEVLKTGEKVIVDPESSIQRIMLIFYGMVNVGAFYALATTYTEKYVGYWLSFLLSGIVYFLLPILLAVMYKRTYRTTPTGSELGRVLKIIGLALKEGGFRFWREDFWETPKPSWRVAHGLSVENVTWNDKLVDDVRRTLDACRVFLYFPIWNLNDGGIGSVSTNQGAAMTTAGAPNDLLSNFNPLTIIVTIPLLSHVIYPWLQRRRIKFGPIRRITFGFILATISGVCGAIVQWKVYETSPCGYQASTCTTGVSPLSIWIQVPNISLGAISECFCNVTAYELAYSRAPNSMRAVVMAIFLFMTALSSALAEILSPVIEDPYLIWVWAGPTIALAVQTVIFWIRYRHMDDEVYMIPDEDESTTGVVGHAAPISRNESLTGSGEVEKEAEKVKN